METAAWPGRDGGSVAVGAAPAATERPALPGHAATGAPRSRNGSEEGLGGGFGASSGRGEERGLSGEEVVAQPSRGERGGCKEPLCLRVWK